MAGRLIESGSWAEFTAAVAAAVSSGAAVVISGARVPGGTYCATVSAGEAGDGARAKGPGA